MTNTPSTWIRSSRQHPCPVCERTDWCTQTEDGSVAKCMRVMSDRPVETGGWIHRLKEASSIPRAFVKREEKAKEIIDWEGRAQSCYDDAFAFDARIRLAEQLGVSTMILEALRVGARHDFTAWPELDAEQNVVGISRRFWDGTKKSMQGSGRGIYYVPVWKQFSKQTQGATFIVEGGSDTAVLSDIGVPCIGRSSNVGGVKYIAELLKQLPKSRDIVVIGERDRSANPCRTPQCPGCGICWPGRFGMERVVEQLRKRFPGRVYGRMPPLKDVREWFRVYRPESPGDFVRACRNWEPLD